MALRREVRLRKEFLHKKQESLQQSQTIDKKRQLKEALDEGKVHALVNLKSVTFS